MKGLLLFLLLSVVALEAQNLVSRDWSLVYQPEESVLKTLEGSLAGVPINLGFSWETQGVHNYDTVALGCEFLAPEAMKKEGLTYAFYFQAEGVEAYLNGRLIGVSGGRGQLAQGTIPDEALRWGAKNRLLLKVVNHTWTGGEVPDFVRVEPAGGGFPKARFEVVFANPWHDYPSGEELAIPVRLEAQGAKEIPGTLRLRVNSDFHEKVLDCETPFYACNPSDPMKLSLGVLKPGFYAISLRFSSDEGGLELGEDFWIAVDPTRLVSTPWVPEGLAAYWERAKADLEAVAPDFRVEPELRLSTAKQKVYTVTMRSFGGLELKAWYFVPVKPGRYPAVLHLPGYSVAMNPEWFLDGAEDFVHLALDIRGHGRSARETDPGFSMPGFIGHDIHEAERYVYRGAYMDCGRALAFLGTRDEVDASRVAVEGMSQGGGLALAAAALFPERVKACAAGVPFLGVPQEHFRIRTVYREEMERHLVLAGRGTWADTLRSLGLVDTRNLADRISCPVFMAVALRDDDCPPHIGFAVYNALQVERSYRLFPDYGHLMNGEWPKVSMDWIRKRLLATQAPSRK